VYPSFIPLPVNGYLTAYITFTNGTKTQTLSSVTNSAPGRKPSMPGYVREPLRTPNPVAPYTPRGGNTTSTPRGSTPRGGGVQAARGRPPKPKQPALFVYPPLSSVVNVPGLHGTTTAKYSVDAGKQVSVTPFTVQQVGGRPVVTSGGSATVGGAVRIGDGPAVQRLYSPEKQSKIIQSKHCLSFIISLYH